MDTLTSLLDSPLVLALWVLAMVPSLIWTIRDLRTRNAHLMPLMKVVWALTVLYSGPIGLMVYRWSGRKEIPRDTLARRGMRSVAHCYSGCGMGEIIGVTLAAGILALGTWPVAVTTFTLAYVFGFALTVGPLVQGGTPVGQALKDAALAETPSITVMEVTAIGVSLILSAEATMGEPRFWSALIVSLSCGLFVAWPVNVWLISRGVKEGMMDPRNTDHGAHGAGNDHTAGGDGARSDGPDAPGRSAGT
ncbi:hypothetical protein ROJ8625_02379 [Roseivivax jejudonensis]|uniref:DUF4396 domain-containing protein n=1 Tax=Roseivivax jejudonensis TaxID=1529041 RepID=A0A1X6ZE43_9RHOB|nr:DUF4396 domain-containing protein [Roseivivax jejudonensis]SLN48682.1 hypothetical protein ROJ8625_02379 [Roseivivax jejudonensis]